MLTGEGPLFNRRSSNPSSESSTRSTDNCSTGGTLAVNNASGFASEKTQANSPSKSSGRSESSQDGIRKGFTSVGLSMSMISS